MIKKQSKSQLRLHGFLRTVFTILAVGFTLISVYSQFKFYRVLFGIQTAALISIVLETTRIASLFKFLHTRSNKVAGALTIAAYILTASISAWGAINSFTTEVIMRERQSGFEETMQIQRIKTAYSKKIDGKLSVIEKQISRLQTATAKYPTSRYWQNRMSQAVTQRHKIITQRQNFLNEQPKREEIEKWIQANAAKLGLKIEEPSQEEESLKSVTLALYELWGIEAGTAKKILGIVITMTVEAGILLLAFLGSVDRKNEVTGVTEAVTEFVTVTDGVTKTVTSHPDNEQVVKFIEANRDHFKKKGKLLPMRKLTVNLRPVRKTFEGFDREELEKMFAN